MTTRGWGPFKEEFYSLSSNLADQDSLEFGLWRNVYIGKLSNFIYDRWPGPWKWLVNLRPLHARFTRKLQKFFPNLQ